MAAEFLAAEFEDELNRVLPPDLPNRETVVQKAAVHLALIVEANQYLNLTRIVTPREAAIKHVLDSVIPWRMFVGAKHILDAGTGAGFPGVPLGAALPDVRFMLAESVQKKTRFVESALLRLQLPNVTVSSARAEELAVDPSIDTIVARALAPVSRALGLFGSALKKDKTVLLYKGPDAEREIAEAAQEAKKIRASMKIAMRYDLPDGLGSRTIVEITRQQT